MVATETTLGPKILTHWPLAEKACGPWARSELPSLRPSWTTAAFNQVQDALSALHTVRGDCLMAESVLAIMVLMLCMVSKVQENGA